LNVLAHDAIARAKLRRAAEESEDALRSIQRLFPGAVLEDLRIRPCETVEPSLGSEERGDMTIRDVQDTTFSRMKATAIGEAERIEAVQRDLAESGRIPQASEEQLRKRDDFDAMVRLLELIEKDAVLRQRILELKRR
jgi:hypothetical protein